MVKETIVWPKSEIGPKMTFECLINFKYNTYNCIIFLMIFYNYWTSFKFIKLLDWYIKILLYTFTRLGINIIL